jgi:hypothetical protein
MARNGGQSVGLPAGAKRRVDGRVVISDRSVPIPFFLLIAAAMSASTWLCAKRSQIASSEMPLTRLLAGLPAGARAPEKNLGRAKVRALWGANHAGLGFRSGS